MDTELKEALGQIFGQLAIINGRLDSMDSRMDSIDNRLDSMDSRMDCMESRLDSMDKRMDSMEDKVSDISLTLENETNKKLNLMYESHQSIIAKLEKAEEIEPLKSRVCDVERAVKYHTEQIRELAKA